MAHVLPRVTSYRIQLLKIVGQIVNLALGCGQYTLGTALQDTGNWGDANLVGEILSHDVWGASSEKRGKASLGVAKPWLPRRI